MNKLKYKVGDKVHLKGTDNTGIVEKIIRGTYVIKTSTSKVTAFPEDLILIEEFVEKEVKPKLEIIENKFNFNSIYQIWDNYKVFFVFSDDGSISCRLSFYDDTPQDAIISDLYVHENMRKQGGATAILNWCFECAKERGCNSVSLRSDNDDWVREWYKRIGFKIESTSIWLTKNI